MNLPTSPDTQIEEIASGYPIIHISNAHSTASIALHGAHLTHYAPHGQSPVIFTSKEAIYKEGKAIRGGIPICWPWFGTHPDSEKKLSAHGYARSSFWVLETISSDPDGTHLTFSLPPKNNSELHATLEFFIGETLELKLTTTNHGEKPVVFSEALHSYFAVGDARKVALLGLDGRSYLDSTQTPEPKNKQHGPVHFPNEIDRIYTSDDPLVIEDPQKQRHISIKKSNSQSSIIWNPGKIKGRSLADLANSEITQFICAESGNVRKQSINLAPGSTHSLTLSIGTSQTN